MLKIKTFGRRAARQRGTVLMEFVLVIPMLAGIIALTYFFGWAMKNQQRVRAANRYAAWRWVHGQHDVSEMNLNQNFFDSKAGSVSVNGWGGGPTDTLSDKVDVVRDQTPRCGDVVDQCVLGTDHWPHGCSAGIGASFPTNVTLWQWLVDEGGIRGHHVREGVEWRRHQARIEEPLCEEFYSDLNQALGSVPAPGDGLGEMARRLFLAAW